MKRQTTSPLFTSAIALLLALALAQAILPDSMLSALENRPLRQAEPITVKGITSGRWMQGAEKYVADQFPLRDTWMSLQALWDAALLRNERGGILIGKGGWMFERCTNLDTTTARDNAAALQAMAASTDIPATLMLVPMSSAIYPEHLPTWVTPDDQRAIIDSLYALTPGMLTIDVLHMQEINAKNYGAVYPLFYRTDHHWTYDGAMLGYYSWKLGTNAPDIPDSKAIVAETGFRGTYFSRAPSPLIPAEPFIYDNPEGVTLLLDGTEMITLHDEAAIQDPGVRDKYAQLLYGNQGRITLLNGQAEGGELLVIKDSYANALLTFLARHYRRIEAIDPRYYAGNPLDLLEEMEAESILCVYGLTTFLSDRSLQLHVDAWGGM